MLKRKKVKPITLRDVTIIDDGNVGDPGVYSD